MAAENPQNESPTSSYQFTVDVNENDYNLHLTAVNISTALEFLLVVKPEEGQPISILRFLFPKSRVQSNHTFESVPIFTRCTQGTQH